MKKMKKIIILTTIMVNMSCNYKRDVISLNKEYESELIQGNETKAESYLDEIIAIDKNNTKYLKLKIPFLVNKCKKEQAIKLIDQILKSDKNEIDLLLLKIVLIPEDNNKKKYLLLELEYSLEEKMRSNTIKRNQTIVNLILVKKMQKMNPDGIGKFFKNYNLNPEEQNVFNSYITISIADILPIVPECN